MKILQQSKPKEIFGVILAKHKFARIPTDYVRDFFADWDVDTPWLLIKLQELRNDYP